MARVERGPGEVRFADRELWWLRIRGALNWRWAIAVVVILLVAAWFGGTGPQRTTCLQARAELNAAQRTLIRDRDRPPEELADMRAQAASASNKSLAYCGQPQLPQGR